MPPVQTDIGPINQDRWQTLQYLRDFTEQLTTDIGAKSRDETGKLILPEEKLYGEYTRLLARCHVELGGWKSVLLEDPYSVRNLSAPLGSSLPPVTSILPLSAWY